MKIPSAHLQMVNYLCKKFPEKTMRPFLTAHMDKIMSTDGDIQTDGQA